MTLSDDQVEQQINEFFEDNFATLKLEGGHSLAPALKELARHQVLMYWRKLRDVAERVTDTEVRLHLPLQETAKKRTFGIEGIVDIVREDERVVMYDIKTHDAEAIRANLPEYEQQLNVYAYIWQELRQQRLDETAVICTQLPEGLRAALASGDQKQIEYELQRWNPVLDVPTDSKRVQATVNDFGHIVDQIEDGEFEPADLERLTSRQPGTRRLFATGVCRYCDARFSCQSYRAYARRSSRRPEQGLRQYLDDFGEDAERSERILAGLSEE